MKKEEIRKEFFKLKLKGFSYTQCKKILKGRFGYDVSTRTLKRWVKRLDSSNWNLKDTSRKPNTIYTKITTEIENQVISLRKKTGWGCDKLVISLPDISISARTIHPILRKHNLCNKSNTRNKPKKYIRWQREHPNSLWQIDISDQKIAGMYLLAVIDDCSRYCIALVPLKQISTFIITHVIDDLITKYCKPREILTDNGSVFGLKSKHSKFDIWCRRRGIKHIRTAIHSPTTTGKIERLFQTLINEIEYCNKDLELFRMRYNHFRPHTSLENKSPCEIYFAFHKLF